MESDVLCQLSAAGAMRWRRDRRHNGGQCQVGAHEEESRLRCTRWGLCFSGDGRRCCVLRIQLSVRRPGISLNSARFYIV
jgi:hypothetical protein